MVKIPVEMPTVERLDRIVETVKAGRDGGEREAGDLDSYIGVIEWAIDICESGDDVAWVRAEFEKHHHAATLGPLTLIEVDAATTRALDGALCAWPLAGYLPTVYVPTYGTAISWFLNVARWSGHPAPGED